MRGDERGRERGRRKDLPVFLAAGLLFLAATFFGAVDKGGKMAMVRRREGGKREGGRARYLPVFLAAGLLFLATVFFFGAG